MMWIQRPNSRLLLVAGLSSLAACALAPKDTVSVTLVSLEPKTEKGGGLSVTEASTLAYLETIENSPNVKAVTRVTHNEDPSLQIGPPVLSPTSNDFVYRIYADEGGEWQSNIWRQTESSVARTRITVGNWIDDDPSFTPNGKIIVFRSNRTSTGSESGLWRIQTEGSGGITRITDSSATDFSPSVGPDGVTIAYASWLRNARTPQVWLTSISGGMVTQLREGAQPRVSPDGKQILFTRENADGFAQIWTMTLDGSQETQLTFSEEAEHVDPDWSPDGKYIIFASNEGRDLKKRKNFDIWLMGTDGSQPTSLTTNGSRDDSPRWNHTGKFIYFRSNRGGWWNIWRFEPNLPE